MPRRLSAAWQFSPKTILRGGSEGQIFEELFHSAVFPKVPDLQLQNWLPGHGKTEVPRLDDPRMDRSDRDLKNPLALDVAKGVLPLLAFQHGVPREILLKRVCPLGPVLVTDQPAQVRVSLGDQAEHVPDFPLIPLGGMDVRRDGGEQPILTRQVRSQQ